jgi:subtilisin family serine protease
LILRRFLLTLAAWLAAAGLAIAAEPESSFAGNDQEILVMIRLAPQHVRGGSDYSDSYGDLQSHAARRRIADQIARRQELTLLSDWPMPLVGVDCFIMRVPASRSPQDAATRISADPRVAWAEPLNLYRAQGAPTPNDPLYPLQPAAMAWRLNDLHEISTGRNVRVAVIDSMVEGAHPDLAGQVIVSENFVADHPATPEQHGTGVAGIIAARADNGVGIVGIAPQARLMALRACWQSPADAARTVCDTLSLARALVFAIDHNAQIINLSLSGPPTPLLGRLIDVALAHGMTVVAAFDAGQADGGFPASHRGVIAVSDSPEPGAILAPGRDIPTTQPGGRWFLVSGSSYAAAHISGLFALLREEGPIGPGALVLASQRTGGGAIDACASLLRASGPRNSACAHASQSAALARP